MKKIVQLIILAAFLNSCTSTKNYSNRKDADNALQDVVQQLNKNANNQSARKALPILYTDVQHTHLANIKSSKAANKEASPRWNDIILEYEALQNAYNTIKNSGVAFKIVQPNDYAINILEIKEAAAEYFYQQALSILENPGRSNAKKAYTYFKICDYYVPGYKEVKSKINIAYGRAVINIVIDSLRDNTFFLNSKWGQLGYDLSNEFFQKKLKTDLENASLNSEYPIAFYIKDEAQKGNVRVDWLLTLNLIDLNISSPKSSSFTIPPISNQSFAENTVHGTDNSFGTADAYTGGFAGYSQAPADNITLNSTFGGSAKVKISVSIKNVVTEKNVSFKTLNNKNKLHQNNEYYDNGLSQTRFSNLYNSDERELGVILESIYAKVYLQIKDNISIALNEDH